LTSIDQQILDVLKGISGQSRPMTIGDFARRFGASPQVIRGAARRLVADHLAEPSMIDDHGVSTLHGLLPIQP
jgi:hypothetical protein